MENRICLSTLSPQEKNAIFSPQSVHRGKEELCGKITSNHVRFERIVLLHLPLKFVKSFPQLVRFHQQ